MTKVRWQLSWLGFVLLVFGQSAFGAHYADDSGFSFDYPDGWVPVNRALIGDVNQMVPPQMRERVAKNGINLDLLSVVLIRDSNEELHENLNVVVQAQEIPVNDEAVQKISAVVTDRYREMGIQLDDMKGRLTKVGTRDAVLVEYQSRRPGLSQTLRQRQILIPGGGKTFIVTCTSMLDTFDHSEPAFSAVLASFQVPPPVGPGINWSRVVGMGLGVGAVFVLGLTNFVLILSKNKAVRTERKKEVRPGLPE